MQALINSTSPLIRVITIIKSGECSQGFTLSIR